MTTTKVARESVPAAAPVKPEPVKPVTVKPATVKSEPGDERARLLFSEAVEAALHTYEQAVANLAGFEHKAAEVARSERMKAVLNLHATFIEDVTAVYVRTARAAMR